jgi:hypothetical protein
MQKLNKITKTIKIQPRIIQNILHDEQQSKVAVDDLTTRLSKLEAILG